MSNISQLINDYKRNVKDSCEKKIQDSIYIYTKRDMVIKVSLYTLNSDFLVFVLLNKYCVIYAPTLIFLFKYIDNELNK